MSEQQSNALKTLEEAKKIASQHPEASFNMAFSVYEKAKKSKDNHIEGLALVSMAFASRSKSDVNAMLEYGFLALPLLEEVRDVVGEVRALNLLGIAYYYSSMFEEALRYFLKVTSKLHFGVDDLLLSSVYNNIGEVYRESGNLRLAKDNYQISLDLSIAQNLKLNEATILSNIGEVHYTDGDMQASLDYYLNAHAILTHEHDMVSLGEVENRIGKIYYVLNQDELALSYYEKSLKRLEAISNKYYVIEPLVNLAHYYQKSSPNLTLDYFLKALDYALHIDSKKKMSEINLYLSAYYERIFDFEAALNYHKDYCHINEEIMASSLSKKLEILQVEINYMNQNLRYEDLKHRLEREINTQRHELDRIKHTNTQLEIKAYEDELTTIKNRRGFFLDYEHYLDNKNPKTICLFLLDIDHFKRYNDYFGHTKGDAALKTISAVIKEISAGRKDLFGRYGGEEFIYASFNLSYEEACRLAHTIKEAVNDLQLTYPYLGNHLNLSISIGGVYTKNTEEPMKELIDKADQQLFMAKEQGRNLYYIESR